jgi:hypothetical protein
MLFAHASLIVDSFDSPHEASNFVQRAKKVPGSHIKPTFVGFGQREIANWFLLASACKAHEAFEGNPSPVNFMLDPPSHAA